MDLEEALLGPVAPPHAGCAAGRALAEMEQEAAEKVRAALGSTSFTHVAKVVRDHLGYDVAHYTWARHHNDNCACHKVGLA